jgi:hypothetical protein
MTIDFITLQHLKACTEIDNPQSCQTFLNEITLLVAKHQPAPAILAQQLADTTSPDQQAKALLCLAVTENLPVIDDPDFPRLVFHGAANMHLLAAAALFLVVQKPFGKTYLKNLFLSASPFQAPPISIPNQCLNSTLSRDARYSFLKALGFIKDPDFIVLLYQILTGHYHFYPQYVAAQALENLGEHFDEEDLGVYQSRSISANAGSSYINITDDDKYTGFSNCPDCRFFPCKITRHYYGGIQDCSLWNKIDPETAGDIVDRRTWGSGRHLQTEPSVAEILKLKQTWLQAQLYFAKQDCRQAVPRLCETLQQLEESTAHDSSIAPLAWFYLAQCFEWNGMTMLTFIAMREASRQRRLIPQAKVAERKRLEAFDSHPSTILQQEIDIWQQKLQAVRYKNQNDWVNALECYLRVNIAEVGKHGGNWFEIGECFQALGALDLAVLFMRKAAILATEPDLARKFLNAALHIVGGDAKNED